MSSKETEKNPLASAPIGGLMMKYAIPSVVALVVNALYNIVDQIFMEIKKINHLEQKKGERK